MNLLLNRVSQFLLLLALTFTAAAQQASRFSPDGRRSTSIEDIQRFAKYISQKTSSNPEDVAWWNSQNLAISVRVKSVACEQAFLREAQDPQSSYAESLALCSKYDVALSSFEQLLKGQYIGWAKEDAAAWSSIMRYYVVLGLLKTKNYDRALQELKDYDAYADSYLKWPKEKDSMYGISHAALSMRHELTRTVSKAVVNIQPNAHTELLARIAQQEIDAGLVPGERDKREAEANRPVSEADKQAHQASMTKLAKEIEKQVRERNIKEAEEARTQRYTEINQVVAPDKGRQDVVVNCECTRQEQAWVPNYSGSGIVKSVRGHFEFKTVKYPCACK